MRVLQYFLSGLEPSHFSSRLLPGFGLPQVLLQVAAHDDALAAEPAVPESVVHHLIDGGAAHYETFRQVLDCVICFISYFKQFRHAPFFFRR